MVQHVAGEILIMDVSIVPFIFDICLQRVKKVIGIEMCQEAVEDAKVNAKLNGKTPDNITTNMHRI